MRKISIIPLCATNTCRMVQSFDIIVPLMNQTTMRRNHSNKFSRNFVNESEEWEQADSRYLREKYRKRCKKSKARNKNLTIFCALDYKQKKRKTKITLTTWYLTPMQAIKDEECFNTSTMFWMCRGKINKKM